MTTYKHVIVGGGDRRQQWHDFGLKDERGRAIGFRWATGPVRSRHYEEGSRVAYRNLPFAETEFFRLSTSPTRDRRAFGPEQPLFFALTLPEITAEAERRLNVARTRYEREYS